jgi:hypothetical protein
MGSDGRIRRRSDETRSTDDRLTPAQSVGLPAPEHRRQPNQGSDIRRTSFPEEINDVATAGSWRARCRHPDRTAGTTELR